MTKREIAENPEWFVTSEVSLYMKQKNHDICLYF